MGQESPQKEVEGSSAQITTWKEKLARMRRIPRVSRLERTFHAFRPGEKLILYILAAILSLSTLALLSAANATVSTIVPLHGGSLKEGIVGPARFLNPLLALSQADKDISALVYSGLMRATPEGTLIPDLAQSYEISSDGTRYTFTLRPDLTFHDGVPLTSADVLFTVQRAEDPDIKSGSRADWEGVSVSAPDPRTIVFTLPHPYAPFLENTALGILPKHLWENVSGEEFTFSPLNTHPIGSGPFRFGSLDTNDTGSATRYTLTSFRNFSLGEPYLSKITFIFYPGEEALVSAFNAGSIDAVAGISPGTVEKISRANASVAQVPLPRTFGIFFNQNKNTALADAAARDALNQAIDKKAIVQKILHGYGKVLEGPIPPGTLGHTGGTEPQALKRSLNSTSTNPANSEKAKAILSRGGWTFDENAHAWKKKNVVLQFTLATADEPELSATANMVAKMWRDAGIKVDVHVYTLSELNSVVIRPRNYEALLFGEVVDRSLDLFAFWHSSQRNDPGLNLAMYTNAKVDTLLSRARAITDKKEREKIFEQFGAIIAKDQPAVFLYAPEFMYVVPNTLEGIRLGTLNAPAERYLNVYEWYTETERVWNIFAK